MDQFSFVRTVSGERHAVATVDQRSIACEIANLAQTLSAAHERLMRCISTIDDCQHSEFMQAQQPIHLGNEREQLRSAAAKVKRALGILTLISAREVHVRAQR